MKRDHLREYLQIAMEAYNLAATPQPHAIFRDTQDECEEINPTPALPTDNRKSLLDLSIDIKRIVNQFISSLPPRRAERFILWVQVGFIEQFHTEHREQIKEDRKQLENSIIVYRISSPPY